MWNSLGVLLPFPQKPVTMSVKFVCAFLVALVAWQVSTTTTFKLLLHAIGRANRKLLLKRNENLEVLILLNIIIVWDVTP